MCVGRFDEPGGRIHEHVDGRSRESETYLYGEVPVLDFYCYVWKWNN